MGRKGWLNSSIGCGSHNYRVINFVSHVETLLIKIHSNNLNIKGKLGHGNYRGN